MTENLEEEKHFFKEILGLRILTHIFFSWD